MSTAAEFTWTPQDSKTELCPLFEYAPVGLAQCQRQGNITALNPALDQVLGGRSTTAPSLCFGILFTLRSVPKANAFFANCLSSNVTAFRLTPR
jgi:hypothetical protein